MSAKTSTGSSSFHFLRLWKIAWREFRSLRTLAILMVVNLSWGLSGYLGLATVQGSLKDLLRAKAKDLLGADISVSSRRKLSENELRIIDAVAEAGARTKLVELFSMVVTPDGQSRLIQVRAIDSAFPLYGELQMQSGRVARSGMASELQREPIAWVYPEVMTQLGLRIGDQVDLGGLSFRIAESVVDDSSQSLRMASLAPKIYIGRNILPQTKLVQFGTTMTESILIKFAKGENLAPIKERLISELSDPAVNVTTYLESGEDTGRFLGYLFDYLGLGALVGVSLATFGMAALIRSWVQQKTRQYAIYAALGLTGRQMQWIFLMQLTILSIATTVLSVLLIRTALPLAMPAIQDIVRQDFQPALQWQHIVVGFSLIWLGSIGVALPSLRQLRNLPVGQLFAEQDWNASFLSWQQWILWLPLVGGFAVLSVVEAQSFRLGAIFFAALVLSYLILAAIGWASFRLLHRAGGAWWMRQGFVYLARKPALLSTFISLSLGSMLTVLIPQIRYGLHHELAGDRVGQQLPDLFLFDIQDEQRQTLQKFLVDRGHELKNVSPLIRARILSVNGVPYERMEEQSVRTRESEQERRMRNRGVNLSFREGLFDSEEIVAGKPFSRDFAENEPVEISVEKWFAERIGLSLGDQLEFDVQGVELPARVISFREVKWNKFQPNFFVLVHPLALRDAPKIWLANLTNVNPDEKLKLQTDVTREFSNVAMVDVAQAVQKILEVVNKMTFALQFMAIVTWVSGVLVLLSLLYRQMSLQRWDANLFRLLGASQRSVFLIFQTQFGLLAVTAVIFGASLAMGIAFVLSQVFFNGIFAVDFFTLGLTILTMAGLSIVLTSFFSLYLSRSNPAGVLQEVRL